MKIKTIGSNQTEIHKHTNEHGEIAILYSYTTPVAVRVDSTGEVYKTSAWYSKTTTRHVNKWLEFTPDHQINEMSQANIERIIEG
jgi:hypothetical protein